jgi:putative restriction endonuclease
MADFLPFDAVVPLEHAGCFYEARLRNISDRSRIGVTLQGRSVRPISDEEFGAIVRAGLASTLAPENAASLDLDAAHVGHKYPRAAPSAARGARAADRPDAREP